MKRVILVIICLMFFFVSCAPSPEDCVKCGTRVYGIALLNLATGESWEVEISGDRGTMSYGSYAGLSGTMNVGAIINRPFAAFTHYRRALTKRPYI